MFEGDLDQPLSPLAGVFNPLCLRWKNFTMSSKKSLDRNIDITVAGVVATVRMVNGYGCAMVPIGIHLGGKHVAVRAGPPLSRTWFVPVRMKPICSMDISESIIPSRKLTWRDSDVVCIHKSTTVSWNKELRVHGNVTIVVSNDVSINIHGKLRSFAYLGNNVIFTSPIDSPSTPHVRFVNSFSVFNGIWLISPNGKTVLTATNGGLFWANGGILVRSNVFARNQACLYFEHTRIRFLDVSVFLLSTFQRSGSLSHLMYAKDCYVSLSKIYFSSAFRVTSSVLHIEGSYNHKSGHVLQNAVVVAAAEESIPHAIVLRRCRKVSIGEIVISSNGNGVLVDIYHLFSINWAHVDAFRGLDFMRCPEQLDIANYIGPPGRALFCYRGVQSFDLTELICAAKRKNDARKVDYWNRLEAFSTPSPNIFYGFTHFPPIGGICPHLSDMRMHGSNHRAGPTYINGVQVVLKIPRSSAAKKEMNNVDTAADFALLRASFLHHNIPKGFGACKSGNTFGFFVEKCTGVHFPDLSSRQLHLLGRSKKLNTAIQIANALYYIHRLLPFDDMNHNDLYSSILKRPHNILIDTETAEAALIDLDGSIKAFMQGVRYSQRREVRTFGLFLEYLFADREKRLSSRNSSDLTTLIRQCKNVTAFPNFEIEDALTLLEKLRELNSQSHAQYM